MKKVLCTTMYNRNYGGFDYVRIHSELLKSVLNRKLTRNCGYTQPLINSVFFLII